MKAHATGSPSPQVRYDEAVKQWAYCIHADNGLQGLIMGKVFTLADFVGRNATDVVGDLRQAQADLAEALAGDAE